MVDVVDLLERPLYSAAQAAPLLSARNGAAVLRWVDGYSRRGVDYPPVIRERRTGADLLTWGEFVEARYLVGLRSDGVSLQKLRRVVAALRDRFGVRYPLATLKPFVDGRDVVLHLQEAEDLPADLRVVEMVDGQLRLSLRAQEHVRRVRWDAETATAIRPDGTDSPVIIDPRRGFGLPSLEGRNVKTETLADLVAAGDPEEQVAWPTCSTWSRCAPRGVRAASATGRHQRAPRGVAPRACTRAPGSSSTRTPYPSDARWRRSDATWSTPGTGPCPTCPWA